jgi:hypothetical protein
MSEVATGLALMARLAEAVQWDDAIRRHEDDPWAYMKRKLESTAGPLKQYKQQLFDEAKAKLFADLAQPEHPPSVLEQHAQTFESLMTRGDFVDLAMNLHPATPKDQRLHFCKLVLEGAKTLTAFDLEALPAEQRGPAWQKRVAEMGKRLDHTRLAQIADREPPDAKRKAQVARRLRRNLKEFLAVTRHESGVREELTLFLLLRVEAAIAASLRFLARWH